MLLVIVFMIITAIYVGYSITQRVPDTAEGHSIPIESETLNQYETSQLFSKLNVLGMFV